LIRDTLISDELTSSQNEPIVGIEAFGDSAINIGYRYWVPTDSFFKAQYNANQKIFDTLSKSNIVIPYPQREIKILKEEV
jgi:small conductance mechanosensitive channel